MGIADVIKSNFNYIYILGLQDGLEYFSIKDVT